MHWDPKKERDLSKLISMTIVVIPLIGIIFIVLPLLLHLILYLTIDIFFSQTTSWHITAVLQPIICFIISEHLFLKGTHRDVSTFFVWSIILSINGITFSFLLREWLDVPSVTYAQMVVLYAISAVTYFLCMLFDTDTSPYIIRPVIWIYEKAFRLITWPIRLFRPDTVIEFGDAEATHIMIDGESDEEEVQLIYSETIRLRPGDVTDSD